MLYMASQILVIIGSGNGLVALSYYLDQCWLIINHNNTTSWNTSEQKCMEYMTDVSHKYARKIVSLKLIVA